MNALTATIKLNPNIDSATISSTQDQPEDRFEDPVVMGSAMTLSPTDRAAASQ